MSFTFIIRYIYLRDFQSYNLTEIKIKKLFSRRQTWNADLPTLLHKKIIALYVTSVNAVIVPKTAFSSTEEQDISGSKQDTYKETV